MKYYAILDDYLQVIESSSFRSVFNAIRREARYGDRQFTAELFQDAGHDAREWIGTISIKRLDLAGIDSILMTVQFWGSGDNSRYRSYTENWNYTETPEWIYEL